MTIDKDLRRRTMCFTGHRPTKLGGYGDSDLRRAITKELYRQCAKFASEVGEPIFISGMALGFDQWAADVVLDCDYYLIAAVPCPGQADQWPEKSRRHWEYLCKVADEVVVISQEYSPRAMQVRNAWMVDRSQVVLACWDGSDGGTANCVRYAKLAPHKPEIRRMESLKQTPSAPKINQNPGRW